MPPRETQLPEGTDKVITGASAEQGGTTGGFVAKSGNAKSGNEGAGGGSHGATDKLVTQVREQAASLSDQAAGKLRGFADDGKDKATDLLDDIAAVIEDAARSIDERLGAEYAGYAHSASGAVTSFAGKIRDKSVDDLLDDTRSIVRKSPTVAIAAAAVVGFALMRVVRTGLDAGTGDGGGRNGKSRGASRSATGTGTSESAGTGTRTGTTTSGGA